MKARLVPVYFAAGRDEGFEAQLGNLRQLLADEAEILEPLPLGLRLPPADAVLFPQLLGDAYREIGQLRAFGLPALIVTSEFGTASMWDWEISTYLRSEGVTALVPYNLELTRVACRSLALRRELAATRFLVFQDNPGEGFQADIFKRFYWWEDECTERMRDKFGVTIVRKSFRELGAAARLIPDAEIEAVAREWGPPTEGVTPRALASALKLYVAVKRELDHEGAAGVVAGAGINCLNESHFSDTTPCLAWDMLYREQGLIWACEADTVSLLTMTILHKALAAPFMMTNVYPFLYGMAALKHERIAQFPDVDEPENCLLLAHCGYLGVLPQSFAGEWTLRPKVLRIVDDNATAIDARLPAGPLTLAKLHPSFDRLMAVEGQLEGYAGYPDSDCRNGAVVRVPDGRRFVNSLYSHHQCLFGGHRQAEIEMVAGILGLEVE